MLFLQLELPNLDQLKWTPLQLTFLEEGLQHATEHGEAVIYIHGPYYQDRFLEVFVCFGNAEHPLLRLSSIRTIFLPFDTESHEVLDNERKNAGFSPVSILSSTNPELKTLAESSIEAINRSLREQPSFSLSSSLIHPKETVVYNLNTATLETQTQLYHAYSNIAYGGTFDRFHPGHKLLLTVCTLLANDTIRIGLIVPELLGSKTSAAVIQPYFVRRANLYRFLSVIAPHLTILITRMVEVIGDVQKIKLGMDCTVLSEETAFAVSTIEQAREANAREELRKEGKQEAEETDKGPLAPPMTYVIVPLVPDDPQVTATTTSKLSSTSLRLLDSK